MTSADFYLQFRAAWPIGVRHDMWVTNPFPLVMAYGQRAGKWDVDSNRYTTLY